jgi:hypothetical protein
MATLVELLNVGKCANGAFLGTATDFCKLDIDRLAEIWRLPYNHKFPLNFEFTLANIQALQGEGKLVKIAKFKTANFTTEENSINTYAGGKKSLMDKMPIQIDATLENGIQGYQSILSVEKASAHSFLLVDDMGNIFMAKGKDGQARGLNSEFFQVMDYKGRGDQPASFMIQFQLNRSQFDNDLQGLRTEDYAFDVDDVYGITDLDLQIEAPINTGTSFKFKVLRNTDRKNFNQEGLEAMTGWVAKVDGSVIAGAVTAGTDEYTFTPTTHVFATGETVSLELPIEFLNDVPFRAFVKSVVVI